MKPCPIIATFNFFLLSAIFGLENSMLQDSASAPLKNHRSIVCAGPSTASAAINPSWGTRLNKLHRVAALGSVLTSCNVAGASGSIESGNSDKGNDNSSPKSLINAYFRVRQAEKSRSRWLDCSADNAWYF